MKVSYDLDDKVGMTGLRVELTSLEASRLQATLARVKYANAQDQNLFDIDNVTFVELLDAATRESLTKMCDEITVKFRKSRPLRG